MAKRIEIEIVDLVEMSDGKLDGRTGTIRLLDRLSNSEFRQLAEFARYRDAEECEDRGINEAPGWIFRAGATLKGLLNMGYVVSCEGTAISSLGGFVAFIKGKKYFTEEV